MEVKMIADSPLRSLPAKESSIVETDTTEIITTSAVVDTSKNNLPTQYTSSSSTARRTAFSIDSILSQKLTTSDTTSHKSIMFRKEMKYLMNCSQDENSSGRPHIVSSCSCEKCRTNGYSLSSTEELFVGSKYSPVSSGYDPYISAMDTSSSLGHVKYGMQEDNERLINKRRRTIFTTSQLERLEYEFQHQQYIVGQERRYLAKQLGLNEIQVKVWFQNRRIKWRKFTHGNTNMPELSM